MAGCGGSSPTPTGPAAPPVHPSVAGSSTTPAIRAILNVKLPPVTSADINADGLLLNRINVFFALTATVGEVNEVANAINGTIAYSRLNSTMVEFAIPRQSGQAALLTMAAQVEQRSGVASASTSWTEQIQELPRDNVGGLLNADDFQQLLAARFPAAWNARALLAGCEARPVTILVTDKFASLAPAGFVSGIPAANFLEDPDPLLDLAIEPENHGFLVTAAMAGAHVGSLPTGAHQRCAAY
ncbi:MAG: hypothetical protein IPG64_20425 [Haliea sp.]|nr:hypothetical protein [Haliea sp.]